ncbi:hypothetical protein PV682_37930 [Streptomyces niveiscabiei]|uniref:hypothetical protein n=1 Tax=Streptomyces niveiscabiei TaxID=164115 RepID=UPI0029B2C660|nr:hypothetical protein [Streptomyces niveiscabiei]MDX3387183.1 hypothetical protein [Streptomyces niveiscabiei]
MTNTADTSFTHCLRTDPFVAEWAADVLAARAERDDIDARPPAHPDPLVALAVLEDFRRRGQPPPTASVRLATGWRGRGESADFAYLARLAGHPPYPSARPVPGV